MAEQGSAFHASNSSAVSAWGIKPERLFALSFQKKLNGVLETVATGCHSICVKFIIEKHAEGYVAYPVGIQGVVVGQGATFDEALRDVQSAVRFHIETFGRESLESENPALDAFIAEAAV